VVRQPALYGWAAGASQSKMGGIAKSGMAAPGVAKPIIAKPFSP